MALYVAVCLLAALIALDENADHGHVRAFALVWGTTIGLALAHAFAFRVSARLAAHGEFGKEDARLVGAQLAGAAFVAAIVTVPVVVFGSTHEFDVARMILAALIATMGYAVARMSDASRVRSLIYGGAVLLVALTIAVIKNILSGH